LIYTSIENPNYGLIADYGVSRQPLLQKLDFGLIDLTIRDKPARDPDQFVDLSRCKLRGLIRMRWARARRWLARIPNR
jgi:hypothetical protein